MPSFNLVTENWIPCIENGQPTELGLQEVLTRAQEITEIYDPSPLVTVSLHRLLLVILHRCFGPRNLEEWKKLWHRKQWDERALSVYFSKWQHRFDLFDKDRPFYQDTTLQGKVDSIVPLTKLARDMAATSSATLFDHSYDALPRHFSFAEAARFIVAAQFYALEDGRGYSPSPLTFGACALSKGNNLFETLIFNLIPYNNSRPIPSDLGKDRPLWEMPNNLKDGIPNGYINYLTWPYRRILLLLSQSSSEVERAFLASGPKIDKSWLQDNHDPFIFYKRSDKAGYQAVKLEEDKALWRDSHLLLSLVRHRNEITPGFINLLARTGIGQSALHVFGALVKKNEKNKITLWRHERLPLPLAYLQDEDLITKLQEALSIAEGAGKAVNDSTWYLSKLLIAPDVEKLNQQQRYDVQKLADHLAPGRPYWAQLGISFDHLVTSLAADKTQDGETVRYGDNTLPWWAKEVRRTAQSAFETTTRSLDHSARMLKAITQAERTFQWRLWKILKHYLIMKRKEVDNEPAE